MTERWPRSIGGDASLDFVNTDVFSQNDRATDVLRSVDEFLAWCDDAGVAAAASVPAKRPHAADQAFLQRAVDVRAAIRAVVEAITEQRDPDPAALDLLGSAFAEAVEQAAPTLDDGRLAWSWEQSSPSGALDELIGDAVALLRDYPAGRLKACPNCGFVFLDTTRNGSRRWCSMDDCGTQVKAQRFVTKRAETRRGAAQK